MITNLAAHILVRTGKLIMAAFAWQKARSEVHDLGIKDPDYLTKLNALSEAEDALSKAVRELKE